MNTLSRVPIPQHMAALPRDERGYPVPWFTALVGGRPDFRIADARKVEQAVIGHRCWICGGGLGRYRSFLIGAMGAMNRVHSEPPSHRDCAFYAVQVCPFLALPKARRREAGKPGAAVKPDGLDIENPGVIIEWVSSTARVFQGAHSLLFELGEPDHVRWFKEGRLATRDEAASAVNAGVEKLLAIAGEDAVARGAVRLRAQTVAGYLPPVNQPTQE
ncbi:hypothetical protein [Burkholderia ambifaria]